MELVLNELSINKANTSFEGASNAVAFARTLSIAVSGGYLRVRSDVSESEIILAENYTYYNWLHSNSDDPFIEQTIKPFLYGVLSTPFMDEENLDAEEQYVLSDYFFEDANNGFPKTRCVGLASAFIANTLSVSFASNDIWKKNILKITIENNDKSIQEDVSHVFSPDCFKQDSIKEHIEYAKDLELIESTVHPNSKRVHLTSHHGQKELKELWSKLKRSPYVLSGLSIEWGGTSFIRNTNENGEIEIVLRNTDRGYAMKVQTTGRNQRETDEIAKILIKKFDN